MALTTKKSVLAPEMIKEYEKEYLDDRGNAILRHALSSTPLDQVVVDGSRAAKVKPVFSIELKTMKATDQKASGRCWIFAALNLLRELIGKKCKIEDFELSQNFIGFYDKLEKFNFLLGELVGNMGEEPSERLNAALLSTGIADGGQWDMFANIVKKYGLCPKAAFDESFQAFTTAKSNALLNAAAREFAARGRRLFCAGQLDELAKLKESYTKKAYSILASSYGVPPTSFDFEYKDQDGQYHQEMGFTPLSFFNRYIGAESLDEYQSLIHAPTADKRYGALYTIEHLGNVVEGKRITHLNLPMERIKELIIATLRSGEPVWFGSDVAAYGDRQKGFFDDESFDYQTAFGQTFSFGKAEMLDFFQSAMNHAMLITGVALDSRSGLPTRWKIENSWGATRGESGYFTMTDSWFTTFVYQAVIRRSLLSSVEQAALDKEPISLSLWDPFGTLAE